MKAVFIVTRFDYWDLPVSRIESEGIRVLESSSE